MTIANPKTDAELAEEFRDVVDDHENGLIQNPLGSSAMTTEFVVLEFINAGYVERARLPSFEAAREFVANSDPDSSFTVTPEMRGKPIHVNHPIQT